VDSYFRVDHSVFWAVTLAPHLQVVKYWCSAVCVDVITECYVDVFINIYRMFRCPLTTAGTFSLFVGYLLHKLMVSVLLTFCIQTEHS
jgi:hypothetical protein